MENIEKELFEGSRKHLSIEEAEYFVNEHLETHQRKSPRTDVLEEARKDIDSWNKFPETSFKRITDLPSFTKFDFGGLAPSLKLKHIHDDLCAKASANGIAMCSITNSAGMHTMHLWVQGLAKRGIFALAGFNGGPDAVVPLNGTQGLLGTNPLSYGFPGDRGDIVIDMATSEIPFFQIVGAKKLNEALPANAAVNSKGEPTCTAAEALDDRGVSNLVPMGNNYKGYNMNYLLEVMTSALLGTKPSSEMTDFIPTEHGGFIIAIAINRTTTTTSYAAAIGSLNKKIRSQRPKAGVKSVEVPGDRNLARGKKG
jgi:ureidoglycolate dehydrogenase (NAD+)